MNEFLFLTLFSKGIINGLNWVPIFDFPINSPEEINSRAVVEVFNERGEICNGTHVGGGFILTAGHCVFGRVGLKNAWCDVVSMDIGRDIAKINCADRLPANYPLVHLGANLTKKIYILHWQCLWTVDPTCKNKLMYSPGEIKWSDGTMFYHDADTLGGSSGSSVFNEHHELIGIHTGHNINLDLNMGGLWGKSR